MLDAEKSVRFYWEFEEVMLLILNLARARKIVLGERCKIETCYLKKTKSFGIFQCDRFGSVKLMQKLTVHDIQY